MKRFHDLRRRHHTARVAALTGRLAHISARMDHIEPGSPEWEALNARRVDLWWKRNAQYTKLAKPTKES